MSRRGKGGRVIDLGALASRPGKNEGATMLDEKQWVMDLAPRIENALQGTSTKQKQVRVAAHKKLYYAHEVFEYGPGQNRPCVSDYQTDLLVFDDLGKDRWTPRVVIECKLGQVTTHDTLTYSAKASTHKQVHPYLRYGILIGRYGENSVPGRLFRHGAFFDFMVTWAESRPRDDLWAAFVEMLEDEVRSSRKIQEMLLKSRSWSREKHAMVHRPLRLS